MNRYDTCPKCGGRKSAVAQLCIFCSNAERSGANHPNYKGERELPTAYARAIKDKQAHPEHWHTRMKTYRRVRAGHIVKRFTCEAPGCGCTQLEAHHEDYGDPDRVYWLGTLPGKGGCGHHRMADQWGIDALNL